MLLRRRPELQVSHLSGYIHWLAMLPLMQAYKSPSSPTSNMQKTYAFLLVLQKHALRGQKAIVSCQVLLRNDMILVWTGARNGTEIELVYGDVLLDKGLVVAVGYIPPSLLDGLSQLATTELRVEDLGGAWVTPGLVDLHSHLGVSSALELSGQSLSSTVLLL
jgi:hypothetical protein